MVELKNVSVAYSNQKHGEGALHNVNLRINDGEFAFVVGSNGAGKSTLIKLLLKEINATDGIISVNGYTLSSTMKRSKITKLRRTIGVIFQDIRLIKTMTVYENIAFVLRVIDAPKKYIRKRVPYVISLVGLQDKAKAYPDELSGGEQQRVAIARALVNDPKIIIADEPTGNIDPEYTYEFVDLLRAINKCGTTVLMVTHEHELVRHFGGRIINLDKGSIVFDAVIGGEEEYAENTPNTVENHALSVTSDLSGKVTVPSLEEKKEQGVPSETENKSDDNKQKAQKKSADAKKDTKKAKSDKKSKKQKDLTATDILDDIFGEGDKK